MKFWNKVEEEFYYLCREADLRLCFCLCRLLVFPCCGSNMKTKGQTSCTVTAQLISIFVFTTQFNLTPLLSKSKILNRESFSVALQAGLCQTWLKTPKTGFLVTGLKYFHFLFQELYGWTMDAIVKQIGRKNNCKSRLTKSVS